MVGGGMDVGVREMGGPAGWEVMLVVIYMQPVSTAEALFRSNLDESGR
jgi:hypothetical protein